MASRPRHHSLRQTLTLVDDYDKQLLLTAQWVCAEVGIKIPCKDREPHRNNMADLSSGGRVASLMGDQFTEGAIVQHLAKLRQKMEAGGIPVPPALKRGMITKEPSKIYGPTAGIKLEEVPFAPLNPPKSATKAKKPQNPTKKKRSSPKDDVDDGFGDLYGSDDEYGARKKKTTKRSKKAANTKRVDNEDVQIKDEETDGGDETIGHSAVRTRGIRHDYAYMEAVSSEVERSEEEEEVADDELVSPQVMAANRSNQRAAKARLDTDQSRSQQAVSSDMQYVHDGGAADGLGLDLGFGVSASRRHVPHSANVDRQPCPRPSALLSAKPWVGAQPCTMVQPTSTASHSLTLCNLASTHLTTVRVTLAAASTTSLQAITLWAPRDTQCRHATTRPSPAAA